MSATWRHAGSLTSIPFGTLQSGGTGFSKVLISSDVKVSTGFTLIVKSFRSPLITLSCATACDASAKSKMQSSFISSLREHPNVVSLTGWSRRHDSHEPKRDRVGGRHIAIDHCSGD